MLKYTADLRSLAFMAITTALFVFLWVGDYQWGSLLHIGLFILLMLMSVTVSVMAHNQMHVPMWNSKVLNVITELWITVFYGFPVFAWIPTHNRNHHRYNNTEPDKTRTYRFSESNNLITILTYPTISASVQMASIGGYLKERWRLNKADFWYSIVQITVLVAWYVAFIIINPWMWLIYILIPNQFALYVVMFFNYIQHVHADEESEFNHSRNITDYFTNFILFNNALHTVHHMNANMHWSKLREAHNKIKDKIDPSLNEPSFWGYLFRAYILGLFVPKYRTKSMRLKRMKMQES